MSLNRLARRALKVTFVVLLIVSCVRSTPAQTDGVLTVKKTTVIDSVGDAQTEVRIAMSLQEYTQLKSETPNVALLLRQFGVGRGWTELDNIHGRFDDSSHSVLITYCQRGASREVSDGRWSIPLGLMKEADVVGNFDQDLIINAVVPSPLGWASRVDVIRFPSSADEIKFDERRSTISYEFSPELETVGKRARVDLFVDTKPMLLSCLAKCYSNQEFNLMWAARSLLKNTGDAPLEDFRIRFRVAGLSSWSSWQRTSRVYPGQTVVDPFFPVFDLDEMAAMNNSRPAMIEVEYSYRDADGDLIEDSDSYPIQVLARNEVVYSSLESGECVSFLDCFDNLPAVMASLTTPTDPVVQQLVGRIHGYATSQTGSGIAASSDTGDAIKYMRAVYDFVRMNRIAYQTPPGLLVDGHQGQHIKYTRDVLRNRAGTCIDLTVFWMSLLESAGLEPVAVVIPGHAFPAVKLPNGNLIAIESTALDKTFDEAVQIGMQNLDEANPTTMMVIDITEMRAQGITPIDLPEAPVDFLAKMNYRFEEAPQQVAVKRPAVEYVDSTDANRPSDQPAPEPAPQRHPLVGTWKMHQQDDEITATIVLDLKANGTATFYLKVDMPGREPEEVEERGEWSVQGEKLVLDMGAQTYNWPFELVNENQLRYYIEELDVTVTAVNN